MKKFKFRDEEPTLDVGLDSADIVKLSLISWSMRDVKVEKEPMFSKKFIGCSFFLSMIVLTVQIYILVKVGWGVTDFVFCGDIVRLMEDQPGHENQFFKNDGNDAHLYFKNQWDNDMMNEAQEEIAAERERMFPTRYEPGCSELNAVDLLYPTARIYHYQDSKCTEKVETPDEDVEGFTLIGLSQRICKPIKGVDIDLFNECRMNTYSMNLAFDCDAYTRIKNEVPPDKFKRLTEDELKEFYKIRCLDTDQKIIYDINEFWSESIPCERCCTEFIKKYKDDPILSGYTKASEESMENFVIINKKREESTNYIDDLLKSNNYTFNTDGTFDLLQLAMSLSLSTDNVGPRLRNLVINFTNEYDACQQVPFRTDFDKPMTYFKLLKPNEEQQKIIYEPVYKYNYQFEKAQAYAMIWMRKKIQFVNKLAKNWGGKIAKAAESQCPAPDDSSNLDTIARCQTLKVDQVKGMSRAMERYQNFFIEQSQKAIDQQYGIVKFWNDALLKETIDNMVRPCNNTETKKEFSCDIGFRSAEGHCLIKWDCSLEQWTNKICGKDLKQKVFSTLVLDNLVPWWIVSMIILTFTVTNDCIRHLLYMRTAQPLWKLKIVLQVLISVQICFINALLAASKETGFGMLTSSLGMLFLNSLDNIMSQMFIVMSGITLDTGKVKIHTRRDHLYASGFAIVHIVLVFFYSLGFVRIIPITDPPLFIAIIYIILTVVTVISLFVWYMICYYDCGRLSRVLRVGNEGSEMVKPFEAVELPNQSNYQSEQPEIAVRIQREDIFSIVQPVEPETQKKSEIKVYDKKMELKEIKF